MRTNIRIAPDGTTTPITPDDPDLDYSSEFVRELVGGYVEPIILDEDNLMLVDDDGLSKGLAFNEEASQLTHRTVVGPVIVIPRSHRLIQDFRSALEAPVY